MGQETDKYANMSKAERRGELETKFGGLYDEWRAAGFGKSYGREDFVKNCMTIVDDEIERVKKEKALPAIAESREIVKYEKPALQK